MPNSKKISTPNAQKHVSEAAPHPVPSYLLRVSAPLKTLILKHPICSTFPSFQVFHLFLCYIKKFNCYYFLLLSTAPASVLFNCLCALDMPIW